MTTPTPNQPQAAVAAAIPVPAPRARRKRLRAANGIARQFAGPSGPVGHLVTGLLARGNASFNAGWSTNSPHWSRLPRLSSNSAAARVSP